MKKNNKTTKMSKRITALFVGIMMAFTTFTSCVSVNEDDLTAFNNAENSVFEKDEADAEETTEAAEKQDAEAEKQNAEAKKQNAEAEKQDAEAEKQIKEANERADAADERADAADKRANAADERADAADAIAESLKAELDAVHPITVKDGVVWVHTDDFLNAPNGVGAIIKSESGYAMRATSGVHIRLYDDMTWDNSFLVENFDLPMLQKYTIALTNDEGKTAFAASFGNYSWANGGLFTDYRTSQFASELTSMPKNGKSGEQFFLLLSECAVVAYSDGEYRFAIYAGDFEANPTPTPTPTVEPEVIVNEIVKTVVETKTEKVNYCGRCGKLIENCICEPEVKVVEKVVEKTVEVPVEKIVEKVVEIPGETKTEYIYVPVPTPAEPDNNPDRPDDGDFNNPENNSERDDDADFDNGPADMDPGNNPVDDDDFGGDEGPADMNPDNNPVIDDDFGGDEGPADMNNNSNTNSTDGPADMNNSNASSTNGPADMNNSNNYANSEAASNNNDAPENSYASGDDIF